MEDQYAWWRGRRGEWYVVVQFILFGVLFAMPFLVDGGWSAPWSTIGRLAGVVLAVAGAGLILTGLGSLGSNLQAVPHPKDDASLVVTGPYKIVRHPIYSGIVLGGFGWALFMNSLAALIVAVVLFFFFDIKTRREERYLGLKFVDYGAYQARVRKLLPFIY